MAQKKNKELPGMTGAGVEVLEITEIDKAISVYETKKEKRCAESPGEIEAKRELKALLHKHRAKLPLNAEGVPFYRHDKRDYLLEEKLCVKKVATETEDED